MLSTDCECATGVLGCRGPEDSCVCVTEELICDGNWDCLAGEDENPCPSNNCAGTYSTYRHCSGTLADSDTVFISLASKDRRSVIFVLAQPNEFPPITVPLYEEQRNETRNSALPVAIFFFF